MCIITSPKNRETDIIAPRRVQQVEEVPQVYAYRDGTFSREYVTRPVSSRSRNSRRSRTYVSGTAVSTPSVTNVYTASPRSSRLSTAIVPVDRVERTTQMVPVPVERVRRSQVEVPVLVQERREVQAIMPPPQIVQPTYAYSTTSNDMYAYSTAGSERYAPTLVVDDGIRSVGKRSSRRNDVVYTY